MKFKKGDIVLWRTNPAFKGVKSKIIGKSANTDTDRFPLEVRFLETIDVYVKGDTMPVKLSELFLISKLEKAVL